MELILLLLNSTLFMTLTGHLPNLCTLPNFYAEVHNNTIVALFQERTPLGKLCVQVLVPFKVKYSIKGVKEGNYTLVFVGCGLKPKITVKRVELREGREVRLFITPPEPSLTGWGWTGSTRSPKR